MNTSKTALDCDALIIGSGLMGAAVAAVLREAAPQARILMVDGGPLIGSIPGQHLHDAPEADLAAGYQRRVATGNQGFYAGATTATAIDRGAALIEPGMYRLGALGENAQEMEAAALSWNVGGMGIHWAAATPHPWGREVPDFLEPAQWAADLAQASRLLRVNRQPFPATTTGDAVMAVFSELFSSASKPGRGIQPMPMAVRKDARGRFVRTGPNAILPALASPADDPVFELMANTQAIRLLPQGTGIRGAVLRDVRTGELRDVRAAVTVVCADAIRTPQLLYASEVRPTALGRYLNEHAFLAGRVIADPDNLACSLEGLRPLEPTSQATEHLWLPHSDEAQPYHWQIVNQVQNAPGGRPEYSVGLALYVPTEVQRENRLEFSESETDATGMPRITVHFRYADQDRAHIAEARRVQQRTGDAFGPFDPSTDSALLAPGSSLHFSGTVRMGQADDGTSVCDTDCRVWGYDNLYVAGNGVIPTALACNSTLAGMTTAVRAARSSLQHLRV
jgi:choline dehydrogenase-like flavoprotein